MKDMISRTFKNITLTVRIDQYFHRCHLSDLEISFVDIASLACIDVRFTMNSQSSIYVLGN